MRRGSAARRRCLQALENHIAVELAATTVGMEALKLAHGDLAALVERTDAAHQVGDLLIVKVMAISVGVAGLRCGVRRFTCGIGGMWLSIRCGRVLCLLLWLWLVFGILCRGKL